jgi:glycosyltransferase involved in cell wall biosynthesis
MQLPRITLVTPSFNQASFLDMTIRSVLDQNYPNLEFMILDGGSTDNSVEVIRRYENKLAFWVSEKDKGQSSAINRGFARATGDLYAYINSDDTLAPGALMAAAQAYQQGHKWITGWVMYLEPGGDEWPQLPRPMYNAVDWHLYNPICQQGTYWAADVAKKLGPFWENMHYAFDYEFWMRMWFIGKLKPHMLRRCMGGYRLHDASKTVSVWERFETDFDRVRAHYEHFLTRSQRKEVNEFHRQRKWAAHRDEAWKALKENNVLVARKHAKQALPQNCFSSEAWRLVYCAMRGY